MVLRKPASSARAQLAAAAGLWTVVGLGLGSAGGLWSLSVPAPASLGLLALGACLGLVKAALVIRPMARRNAQRILARGDGRCFGGFLSWKSWLFVLAMMAFGALLRASPVPRPVLGVLYVAIGVALLTGSTPLWRTFARAAAGR
jgi:hypothetical protein